MRFLLMTYCFLSILKIEAQDFKWLKSFGSKYDGEQAVCMHANKKDGGSAVLFHRFMSTTTAADTMQIDTFKFPEKPTGRQFIAYLATFDKNGKAKKAILLGNYSTQSFCIDSNDNFYIIGSLYDTFTFKIGSQFIKPTDGNTIFVKYDKNFNLIWLKQYKNIGLFGYSKLFYSEGRILFSTWHLKAVYGEISKDSGKLLWNKSFGNNEFYPNSITSLNKNIYLAGYKAPPAGPTYINGDTFRTGTGYVVKTDSVGNYLKGFSMKSKSWNLISTITTDGKNLFIGGRFGDTVYWGNKKIIPEFPNPGYDWMRSEMFMASLDPNLTPRWFNRPKIVNKFNGSGYIQINEYSDSFIYWGGTLTIPINVNGDTISNPIIILKTDLIGNIMWATTGGSSFGSIIGMSAIAGKSVYACGGFNNTIRFGKDTARSRGDFDAMLVQMSDNAIIRGRVKAGPYCAGDTILIPYKKLGEYANSNQFIAELSDENGDFNGNEIELGRINSDTNGTIIGKLPLFQVVSSPKYRIRILSTSPAVQSYYKADTLRLLIYSKDKAYAGRDTIICKGDSLKLQTFGGTKWAWSPKFKMFDSTARETMVWPDKSTNYTIIIADSSGCGQADTATKTVFVRDALSVQFHTPIDTNVCLNGIMPLIVSFHGGDSTGYSWQWTAIDSKNNYYFPQSGSGKQRDTLLYTQPITEKDSIRFSVYLNDGCTRISAFAVYTLKVKKSKTTTTFKESDTSICPGKMLPIVANFKGSSAALLSWQWQEANIANPWINRKAASNKQSDTFNYTLPLNWKGNKRIRVILKDNCSGLNDTAIYIITPRDTLKLNLNTNDTTLCKGQKHTWKAKGLFGYAPTYQYIWTNINTGDTLSLSDSFLLTASNSMNVKVKLSDGCMPKSIERTFTITVNPALTSELQYGNTKANDTALCYGQSISYKASASGGKGNNYTYRWMLDGNQISTQDNILVDESIYKTLIGTKKKLLLIISDGCTIPNDSSSISLDFLNPLSQSVNFADSICHGTTNTFTSSANGGNGNYTYKWLDNTNSIVSSNNNYQFTHTSQQTGPIIRKSIVSDGCSVNDTINISTELLSPLSLSITASDPCPVNALTLTANASGGRSSSYIIRWFDAGNLIGNGSSISINTNGQAKNITAILSDGCSIPADTQNINTGSKPGVKIEVNSICLGDETSFIARSTNASKASTYQWKIDGAIQTETDSTLKRKFAGVGKYKILVTASNNGSCQGLDSTNIEIIVKPEAAFEFAHFKSQGNLIPFRFINRSQKESNWYWDFGTGDTSMIQDPYYNYTDTGKFWVQLIVGKQGKCFDTARQLIPVYHDISFYFPNVFSPNGNSINETFGLSSGQWFKVSTYTLKIYNRWGELMFSTDQMQEQWTGEGAQQSVYIYTAEIRDVYNVLHKIEGVVELLK